MSAPSGPGVARGAVSRPVGSPSEDLAFRLLALTTTVSVFLLILLGGAVRATGASLACEGWPLCQGQLVPVVDGPPAVELAHRLASLVVGVLVFGTALLSWRTQYDRRWVVVPAFAALALQVAQGLLGGLVVLLALPPAVVVAHLAVAEGILASLLVATIAAFRSSSWPGIHQRSGFANLSRIGAGAVFVVVLAGSAVAGTDTRAVCASWPLCQAQALVDDPYLSGLHTFHRLAVALGGAFVAAIVARALQLHRVRPLSWLVRGSSILALLYLVLAGLGALAAVGPLPDLASVLHLAAGTGVWATLVAMAVLAYGEPGLVLARAGVAPSGGSRVVPEVTPLVRVARGADEAGGPTPGGLVAVPVAAQALPTTPAGPALALVEWLRDEARVYVELTKPRIIVLLLITTIAGMLLAAPPWPGAGVVIATIVGGALAAGGANALNQYFDRDVDELMRRTRRRPLPSHRVSADEALVFGIALGAFSFLLLVAFVNLLAAALSLVGLLFYVFVYTLLLKRTTPQNIVIGGAAGAIPPLVGWAAARGDLSVSAYILFAIIFFWTPPHFWSLSIMMKRDYEAAGIPMLPVVAGDDEARRQIRLYAIAVAAISLGLYVVGENGVAYLVSAAALGAGLVWMAHRQVREATEAAARRTFLFSNAYLALLFLAMVLDHVLIPL